MPLQVPFWIARVQNCLSCMRDLAMYRRAPGIVELTDDLQVAVAKKWLRIQAEAFTGDVASKDKTFFFPESWDWP